MVPKYLGLVLSMLASAVSAQDLPADPTRPSGTTGAVTAQTAVAREYVLTYVKVAAGQNMAIINGQNVKIGSWVDGARVVQISAQGARLETDSGIKTLSIGTHAGFNKQKRSRN